jgi:hypothetical protein
LATWGYWLSLRGKRLLRYRVDGFAETVRPGAVVRHSRWNLHLARRRADRRVGLMLNLSEMDRRRVLVCGGRRYAIRERLFAVLDELPAGVHTLIVGVDPKRPVGADGLAWEWAGERQVERLAFPADWYDLSLPDAVIRKGFNGRLYDAYAGPRRNQAMLDEGRPGLVVSFPGGNGTADMVRRARTAGVPVMEVE